MGLAPKQLGHLVMKVRDLERSEDFYTRRRTHRDGEVRRTDDFHVCEH